MVSSSGTGGTVEFSEAGLKRKTEPDCSMYFSPLLFLPTKSGLTKILSWSKATWFAAPTARMPCDVREGGRRSGEKESESQHAMKKDGADH